MTMAPSNLTPEAAAQALDEHFLEILRWHFSPETGTPYWIDWAEKAGWNPVAAAGARSTETSQT